MGNTIFIKDRRVCVKPLRCRLKATKNENIQLESEVLDILQAWLTC